jgi:hypothetical protein
MSRNLVALGAFVLAGGLLWLITEWPAAKDDATAAPAALDAPASPQPTAAEAQPPSAAKAREPAVPAPQEPEQEPAPAPQVRAPPELIRGDQGPVAEYRKQFETEPRDSTANALEGELRAAFPESDGVPDLIKSVLCRQTICRMEMRWSQDRMRAYILGFTRFQHKIQIPVAVSPVGPKNPDGLQLVEVYMKLKAEAADHQH